MRPSGSLSARWIIIAIIVAIHKWNSSSMSEFYEVLDRFMISEIAIEAVRKWTGKYNYTLSYRKVTPSLSSFADLECCQQYSWKYGY